MFGTAGGEGVCDACQRNRVPINPIKTKAAQRITLIDFEYTTEVAWRHVAAKPKLRRSIRYLSVRALIYLAYFTLSSVNLSSVDLSQLSCNTLPLCCPSQKMSNEHQDTSSDIIFLSDEEGIRASSDGLRNAGPPPGNQEATTNVALCALRDELNQVCQGQTVPPNYKFTHPV